MKYVRMHQVDAEPMTRGDYDKLRGWGIPENENPAEEGYIVHYPDGYVSWCPKAKFEAAGRPCDGMTFGMAIEAMKRGKRVARRGWNENLLPPIVQPAPKHDKEAYNKYGQFSRLNFPETVFSPRMYLWLLPAANVKAEWCKEEHLKALAEQNGGEFECLASIRMKTADDKVLTGWLASQTDMLAEDWEIVE